MTAMRGSHYRDFAGCTGFYMHHICCNNQDSVVLLWPELFDFSIWVYDQGCQHLAACSVWLSILHCLKVTNVTAPISQHKTSPTRSKA